LELRLFLLISSGIGIRIRDEAPDPGESRSGALASAANEPTCHTRNDEDERMGRREQSVQSLDRLTADPQVRGAVLERVRHAVEHIRFGEVRVIIQDGLIVQIDRVEKERLR
jgi:hypothetical protein